MKHIYVAGTEQFVSKEDLNNLLNGQVLGANILGLDPKDLESALRDNFLGIKSVTVTKDFPDIIEVLVLERVPKSVVCDPKKECFYIDGEGYVLGATGYDETDFPIIDYSGDIFIGKILEEDVIPVSFEILNFSKKQKISVSSISYKPDYSEMYINDDIVVLISHSKDKSDALKIVASLLNLKTDDGRSIRKIDLRYDKVVVSYD
ncbi:FtsQ-type POTRA domain-containing protein [Patescibacteria group bacterium]|nr:FtsQ-type POTRA domain-containing protein [Patescibacteria group bacterium]